MRAAVTISAFLAAILMATPTTAAGAVDGQPKRLKQIVDFSAGTKFGPPENAFKLVSQGGPYSSIKGTRTTDVKAGTPPSPPVFKFSYKPGRTDTPAPKSAAKKDDDGDDRRKLLQIVDFSAGTKFGPPENAFKLVSQGGPYSSIKGTRTTDVKAGTPPSPPVFKFSYKPGRTDTPAPKSAAKKDNDDDRRKLLQIVDFSAGTKFGPPENAFKLVSQGGPYSSIKGTRTTDVKAGTPPSPPVFKFSYKAGRTDTPAPKSNAPAPKGAAAKADAPAPNTAAPAPQDTSKSAPPAPKSTPPAPKSAAPAPKNDAPKDGAAQVTPKDDGKSNTAAPKEAPKADASAPKGSPAPAAQTGTPAPTTGSPAPAPKEAAPAPQNAAPAPGPNSGATPPTAPPQSSGQAAPPAAGDDDA